MSVKSIVESDMRFALRAYQDTQGMSDPERTAYWLERLARHEYRGRGDTITAARDRAAQKYGAPISKTKRVWDRWQTMKSVAGEVMIPLMLAYEAVFGRYEGLCERIEAQADAFKRERIRINGGMNADREIRHPARVGMDPAEDCDPSSRRHSQVPENEGRQA